MINIKKALIVGALAGASLITSVIPAFADSTGSNASPQGQCFGQQASNYASTAKDNSTGQAVSVQGQAGTRNEDVVGYKADCPYP